MKWFIPGNVPSSKNGRRWTGKYFIASKATVNYKKASSAYYTKHAAAFRKEFLKHPQPVTISFTFIRGSRRKFDQINPAQTVQDEMVRYGWLEDDNADILTPAFEDYRYDKENPGVEIKIINNGGKPRRKN